MLRHRHGGVIFEPELELGQAGEYIRDLSATKWSRPIRGLRSGVAILGIRTENIMQNSTFTPFAVQFG